MSTIIYLVAYSLLVFLTPAKHKPIPFNISKPELKIELSGELKEISGLTWFNHNQLGAVQDEVGIFYLLNAKTGVIEEKIKFAFPGDFEGVESIGDCIYTLTSSGTIHYFNKNNPKEVKRIKTPISLKNDAEGLGYNSGTEQLLILCKEHVDLNKKGIKGKSVFSLDINSHHFSKAPVATIKKSAIEKFVEIDKFNPSGLAIDPITNDLYIIASAGQVLVVLDNELKVKNAVRLPAKKYAQPEGICFSPDGDLYISNEGKGGKANFYHLKRKS